MAFIVETLTGDKRLQLGYEEFVRPMSFGTRWTKIRIAVRCNLNGYNTFTGALVFGVCQGGIGYFSPFTIDYFGASSGSNLLNTSFTYTGGVSPYFSITSGYSFFKKQGTTTTNGAAGGSSVYISGTPNVHSIQMLDITKGSPNYSINAWGMSSAANAQTDISLGTFYATVETEASPPLMASAGSSSSIAYSSQALFDCVSVFWGKSIPTIDISDIVVCRFT